jgi:hypothetical protein
MKKIAVLILALVLALPLSACEFSDPSTNPEQIYNYDAILSGDLTDFAGIWKNGLGETFNLTADGTQGNELTEDGITYIEKAAGFEKMTSDYYRWGCALEDYDGPSGYDVWLFPVGVDVVAYNSGELVQTDTTKVRMYAGHDFYPVEEMSNRVFYLQ